MQLRDYQDNFIEGLRGSLKAHSSILGVSPTGSGKTVTIAYMLKKAAEKGMPCLFVVHRKELIDQSVKTFKNFGIECGIIAAGYKDNPQCLVQVAMIQTLARRKDALVHHDYKFIIFDECHHVASSSWAKLFERFPRSFKIGLTATPERLDGKGLKDYFHDMVSGPSVSWLIQNKFLSDYVYYAPSKLDLKGIHKSMGDYNKKEIDELIKGSTIIGDCLKHYTELAAGKRAVVFCANVRHSKKVAADFEACGYPSAHIDATTNKHERADLIEQFRHGQIKILTNVDLFGEGFDLPAIEVAILLRPTASLSLFLQQVGRALRPSPGKQKAIILDHVGNYERHGMPDQEREWSLDGRKKRADKNLDGNVRVCPECFAANVNTRSVCSVCGHTFAVVSNRSLNEIDGKLTEIDKEHAKKQFKKQRGMAKTHEELVEIGIQRGMKNPHGWAWNVLQSRKKKWG